MLAARNGLGFLLNQASQQFNMTSLYAVLFLLMVMGMVVSEVAARVETWLLRWRNADGIMTCRTKWQDAAIDRAAGTTDKIRLHRVAKTFHVRGQVIHALQPIDLNPCSARSSWRWWARAAAASRPSSI